MLEFNHIKEEIWKKGLLLKRSPYFSVLKNLSRANIVFNFV